MKKYQLALVYLMSALSLTGYAAQNHRTHQSNLVKISEKKVLVNINQADQNTLQQVKGIGPKKAASIVQYRKANGRFKTINDLTKIKGIGSKRLAKISDKLTV
jgi:competence protein ComEA